MSDSIETIEQAKLRDTRFALIERMIGIETDLRDNVTIRSLMTAVWQDAVQAMEELADTSPTDVNAISLLLVRIKTQVYMRRTLASLIQRGKAAEDAVRADDDKGQYNENEWYGDRTSGSS